MIYVLNKHLHDMGFFVHLRCKCWISTLLHVSGLLLRYQSLRESAKRRQRGRECLSHVHTGLYMCLHVHLQSLTLQGPPPCTNTITNAVTLVYIHAGNPLQCQAEFSLRHLSHFRSICVIATYIWAKHLNSKPTTPELLPLRDKQTRPLLL